MEPSCRLLACNKELKKNSLLVVQLQRRGTVGQRVNVGMCWLLIAINPPWHARCRAGSSAPYSWLGGGGGWGPSSYLADACIAGYLFPVLAANQHNWTLDVQQWQITPGHTCGDSCTCKGKPIHFCHSQCCNVVFIQYEYVAQKCPSWADGGKLRRSGSDWKWRLWDSLQSQGPEKWGPVCGAEEDTNPGQHGGRDAHVHSQGNCHVETAGELRTPQHCQVGS